MSQRLMRIGELAERTGLSLPTIRHYDETGLLSPSARTAGNFRLYSEADYEKLMVIRRMKPLGFTVEQMRQLLVAVEGLRTPEEHTGAERAQLVERLRGFIADATERRDRLQRNLDRADEFIGVLRREEAAGLAAAGQTTAGPRPEGEARPA
ncbi:MerR family transcriptional regulator [Geodermatophilus sp. SYSU D01106]